VGLKIVRNIYLPAIVAVAIISMAFFWIGKLEYSEIQMLAGAVTLFAIVSAIAFSLSLNKKDKIEIEVERDVYEQALKHSEKRFKDFAQSVADRFWETDEHYRYTYVSLGGNSTVLLDPKEMIGKTRWEISSSGDDEVFWEAYRAKLAEHKPFRNLRHTRRNSKGQTLYFCTSGVPLFDDQGNFKGYRGATIDETSMVEADKEAVEVQSRFLKAIEALSEGVVFWDSDSRLINCNQFFKELHPKSAHVLKPGLLFEDFLRVRADANPDLTDKKSKVDWVKNHLAERLEFKSMMNEAKLDNRWVLVRRQRFADRSWIAVLTDITERKQAEEKLRVAHDELEERVEERTHEIKRQMSELDRAQEEVKRNEERFRDIAESTSDWFWETDADLNYIYVSPQYYEMFPNKANVLGEKMGQSRKKFGVKYDQTEIDHLMKLIEERKVIDKNIRCAREADGSIRYIQENGKPYFDDQGNFLGYRGATSEVTERIEAEETLKQRERQLRQILETSPIGVGVANFEDGRILFVNSTLCRQMRQSEEELVGHVSAKYWAQSNLRRKFIKVFERDGHVPPTEVQHRRSDGSRFWSIITWESIVWQGSNCVLFWIYDIDDLKRTAVELEKSKEWADRLRIEAETANRSKSEFLANMSHELRTPLNAIIGFADAVAHGVFGKIDDPRQDEAIGYIKESGEHLLELITDILDVSAIEAGNFELSESPVSLKDVSDSAIRMVQQRADQGQIRLVNNIDKNLPYLVADDRRIKQVVVNLLSNAVKFSTEGGEVTIDAHINGDGAVKVTVEDTGIGMDDEGVEMALARFGRVARHDTAEKEGTGLGLPLSKGLVEAHGGSMRIDSQIGEGTTVTFELPGGRIVN